MAKYRKSVSFILVLSLLLTSIFVGGISVSAKLDNLYSTVNDYDTLPSGVEFSTVTYANNPATNVVVNGSPEMEDASEIRHFSAWAAWVDALPDDIGNGNALHFTGAGNGDRSNIYQTIARIYKSDSSSLSHFKATAGKTYEVKVKYYVAEVPSKEIQLQVRQAQWSQCSYQNPNDDDGIWMEPVVIASITAKTQGWVESTVYFTAPSPAYYMNLCLATLTSGSASNVDVWVDDVTVSECAKITAHNYTPGTDNLLPVSPTTTIGDIKTEDVAGYRFGGVFADAAFENRLSATSLAGNYSDLYFNWIPITTNEGYCGFEDYAQTSENTAYHSAVSALSSDSAYVGKYSMKNTLGEMGIAAFEIKNQNSFNIVKDETYTVSFVYKADKDVELYLGTGTLGNVANTAKALSGASVNASDVWKEATLTVTPTLGTSDNYALAMLIYAKNGATVYVDDIVVSGFDQAFVNPTLNTGFSSDWYPNLAIFEGVELPEIWGGQNDLSAPKDANSDGVYEISNGAELAYAIKNGGGADMKYILTKDIYLNSIDAIDWKTGAVLTEGYTPNTWFNQGVSFQGSIDGDGHTIYGLYRKDNPSSMISYPNYGTALVPKVPDNGTVSFKNLAVDNAFINVECAAAAFVGTTQCSSQGATSITVDGCFVGENVQLNGGDAGAFVGYTGGSGCALTFNNSYSLATTSGTANHGLAGVCYQATLTVRNCFNANGPITSYQNANWTGKFTFTDSYQTEDLGFHNYTYKTNFATLSADNMKGTDVFSTGKMQTLNSVLTYVATEGFPKLAFFEGIVVHKIWDGTVAEKFAGGSGTEDDPYQIEDGAQLAYAIKNGGFYSTDSVAKYFVITKDIYLNNIDAVNWETGEAILDGYTPNEWYKGVDWNWGAGKLCSANFVGTIDGNGHTVYGLYFHSTSDDYYGGPSYAAGLIPTAVGETTIKNLKISNAHFLSNYNAGAFVGSQMNGSTVNVDRCYATDSVYITGYNAGVFSGCVYTDTRINLTNSGSLATTTMLVSSAGRGIVAGQYNSYTYIENCFNANGPLSSYWSENWNTVYKFTNSYQTVESGKGGGQCEYNVTTITDPAKMQGVDVFTNAGKMPDLNAEQAFVATNGYPMVSVFVEDSTTDSEDTTEEETEITVWDGSIATEFAGGDGSAANPYQIENGAQLALAISTGGQVNTDGVYTDEANFNKHYIITKDIYLNDLNKINWTTGMVQTGHKANEWLKHENFAGTIDGNGHMVYGLYFKDVATKYTSYTWGMALIPYVINGNTATVKNLGLDNVFINYECGAAAFVGTLNGGSKAYLNGCFVGNNATITGADAGALRGYSQSGDTTSIINCYSLANVTGAVRSNGLVGNMSSSTITVSYCYNANGIIPSGSGVTAKGCYQSTGSNATGITTISAENMKGDDVLTNSAKMPLLSMASAYVPSNSDFSNHDYYIYLPAGTILTEDFKPSFSDSFLVGTTAEKVMEGNTMKQGAFIRFAKEPEANKILVPATLADFIIQGSYEAISSNNLLDKYYGIETEIVSKQLSEQSADSLNYIFITDIHFYNDDWDATTGNILLEQARIITEFANNNDSIDFVVLGGDIVQGFWDTKEGWKTEMTTILSPFTACEKPVFVVIGNHDDNAYATWNVNYGEKIISDLDWKNYVLDPVSPANIVRPEGDPNAKNYYYDLEKNGKITRIFCLDAINYYQEYDENGNITSLAINTESGYTEESEETYGKYHNGRTCAGGHYGADQIKWIAENLENSNEFDDVLFFSHMGTDAQTNSSNGTAPVLGKELQDVIAAYNNKTAYKNEALGIDVTYTDDGKVLSYQYGHIHQEWTTYNANMDLWHISSSTARPDSNRLNTENEACFDIMSVSAGVIRKYNIGAGEDGSFYSENNINYGDLDLDGAIDITDLVSLANTINGNSSKTTAADINRDNLLTFADAEAVRKLILGK